MKSLLISSVYFPPQVGGISQYMSAVVQCLGTEEICCLTGARAGEFQDQALPARVYRRPRAFAESWLVQAMAMGASVAEIMLRERPEVVQLATAYDGAFGLRLQRWTKLPFVIYAHGNEILDAAASTWQTPKLSLQGAARVLANSQFTAGLVADVGVAPEKVVVLHPGCDADRFRPQPPSLSLRQQLLRHRSSDRVILTIGNLVARKGHDMVIQAMPEVLRQVPNAVYLIVGDGPYRLELERMTADAGLQDRVIFAGRLPDEHLPEIYALADVFVMASRMQVAASDVEGFGLVFLEAGACGKPVVAGRSGGIPDAVVDGSTGLLVDPIDPDDIARSISNVLRSPDLAARLGEQGRSRVLQDFTWSVFAARLREILNTVVAEQSKAVASKG